MAKDIQTEQVKAKYPKGTIRLLKKITNDILINLPEYAKGAIPAGYKKEVIPLLRDALNGQDESALAIVKNYVRDKLSPHIMREYRKQILPKKLASKTHTRDVVAACLKKIGQVNLAGQIEREEISGEKVEEAIKKHIGKNVSQIFTSQQIEEIVFKEVGSKRVEEELIYCLYEMVSSEQFTKEMHAYRRDKARFCWKAITAPQAGVLFDIMKKETREAIQIILPGYLNDPIRRRIFDANWESYDAYITQLERKRFQDEFPEHLAYASISTIGAYVISALTHTPLTPSTERLLKSDNPWDVMIFLGQVLVVVYLFMLLIRHVVLRLLVFPCHLLRIRPIKEELEALFAEIENKKAAQFAGDVGCLVDEHHQNFAAGRKEKATKWSIAAPAKEKTKKEKVPPTPKFSTMAALPTYQEMEREFRKFQQEEKHKREGPKEKRHAEQSKFPHAALPTPASSPVIDFSAEFGESARYAGEGAEEKNTLHKFYEVPNTFTFIRKKLEEQLEKSECDKFLTAAKKGKFAPQFGGSGVKPLLVEEFIKDRNGEKYTPFELKISKNPLRLGGPTRNIVKDGIKYQVHECDRQWITGDKNFTTALARSLNSQTADDGGFPTNAATATSTTGVQARAIGAQLPHGSWLVRRGSQSAAIEASTLQSASPES